MGIVISDIAFMFACGRKLGVLEALVLVMIIGLSVDYVVHMADAYLEALADDRLSRTQFMLGKMGSAVVSGASTTIGAAFFMCWCYIPFFQKFGLIILFTVFQSLVTALVFFTSLMALVGPQGSFANIPFPRCSSTGEQCSGPSSRRASAGEVV